MSNRWQLQQAKARLSEVVNLAISDGPQVITRHGEDAVIVVSAKDYAAQRHPKQSLVEFFRKSPLVGVQLDLRRQKDSPRPAPNLG